jgi:hypothetical protein
MEQWLAGGSCLLSLLLVLSTIAAGKLDTRSAFHALSIGIRSSKLICLTATAPMWILGDCMLFGPCWHAGWMMLWHTILKDIGFFREIMGLNR